MSGGGKGQQCKELWGEDAPFVVIYYSESIQTAAIVHNINSFGTFFSLWPKETEESIYA